MLTLKNYLIGLKNYGIKDCYNSIHSLMYLKVNFKILWWSEPKTIKLVKITAGLESPK